MTDHVKHLMKIDGVRQDIQNWDSDYVIKYHYECTYPHCRKPGMIDLSKTDKKTDNEYFLHFK